VALKASVLLLSVVTKANMSRVFLSLGSNIEAEKNIRSSLIILKDLYPDMKVSCVYESEAVGFQGDNFLNLVVMFDTDLSVQGVHEQMNEIEELHGRLRGAESFMARTLDIDLLLYDDLILEDEGLHIPRREIEEYAFVLLPLTELAPDLAYPLTGETYSEMWERFDKGDQNLWAVDLDF